MTGTRIRFRFFVIALLAFASLPAFAAAGSRIVRLSLAQGDVQIDRNTGDGWEQALNNMPVLAGSRLYAAEDSKAELEFEDGSSVRMVGPAQIQMVELSSDEDGRPVNVIQVTSGMVYIDARLRDDDDFRVEGPSGEAFAITQPSQLRFKVSETVASLSVTIGEAQVVGAAVGTPQVLAGQSYNYILGQPESAARAEQIPPQPEDSWNQQREAAEQQSEAQAPAGDEAAAGELNSYGSYSDIPGYGMMWQPSGVGPDWNPYDYGAWSYYPGWGWTFISGYPWGWTPFFYGNWCYIGGRGWWWNPGHPHGPWGGGGWHPRPVWAGNPGNHWNPPHIPNRAPRGGTVAVAGSGLRVGAIAQTHPAATGTTVARSYGSSYATGGPAGRVGVSSNLVQGRVVTRPSSPIVGKPGSYALANGAAGARNGYEVHRPPSSAAPARTPAPTHANSAAPAAIPHPTAAPAPAHVGAPPAASHPSAPAHVFSGGGGGEFHGGGGGFHGGGGHR